MCGLVLVGVWGLVGRAGAQEAGPAEDVVPGVDGSADDVAEAGSGEDAVPGSGAGAVAGGEVGLAGVAADSGVDVFEVGWVGGVDEAGLGVDEFPVGSAVDLGVGGWAVDENVWWAAMDVVPVPGIDTAKFGDVVVDEPEGAVASWGNFGKAPAPSSVWRSRSTYRSVTLSWSEVKGAAGYKLEFRNIGSTVWKHGTYAFSPRVRAVSPLACNTWYAFRIKARGDGFPYESSYGPASHTVYGKTLTCTAPAPQNLRYVSFGADRVGLQWNPVTGAAWYKVEYQEAGDTQWRASYSSSSSLTVNELECYTYYKFRVRARGRGVNYPWAYGKASTQVGRRTSKCSAPPPKDLKVVVSGESSITMSWKAVPDAVEYFLQYQPDGALGWKVGGFNLSGTSRLVPDLECGTVYKFRVLARGDGWPYTTSYGKPSDEVTGATSVCPPETAPAPTDLGAIGHGVDHVLLGWSPVTHAAAYQLEHKALPSGAWAQSATNITGVSARASGLDCGTEYGFRVRARGDGGRYLTSWGDPSGEKQSTTLPCPLPDAPAPTGLGASPQGGYGVSVAWSPVVDAAAYKLEHKRTGAGGWQPGVELSGVSRNLWGLGCNTSYTFRVSARGDGTRYSTRWSNPSGEATTTTGACPPPNAPPPSGFTIASSAVSTITPRWNALPGATLYKLSWRKTGSTSWTWLETPATTSVVPDLDCNAGYRFRVAARGDGTTYSTIFGNNTSEVQATTTECPAAPPPQGLTVTSVGFSEVSLSWDELAGAVAYEVTYHSQAWRAWPRLPETSGTSATVSGLEYDVTYRFKVSARGDGSPYSTDWGAVSDGVTATTTQPEDYDKDDNGLIEIKDLSQLNAMRWDLNGDGIPDSTASARKYTAAFSGADNTMGCPVKGCSGYELTRDLSFDTNLDRRTDTPGDTYWNAGRGWEPIGTPSTPFSGTFSGTFNGTNHTISGLFIARDSTHLGLFANNSGTINGVRLTNAKVTQGTATSTSAAAAATAQLDAAFADSGRTDDAEAPLLEEPADPSESTHRGQRLDEGRAFDPGSGLSGRSVPEPGGGLVLDPEVGTRRGAEREVEPFGGSDADGGGFAAAAAAAASSGEVRVAVLVGWNTGTVSQSSAAGEVTAHGSNARVGLLVGDNEEIVKASHAAGSVSGGPGETSAGVLVGRNYDTVTGSSASGSATSVYDAGGLVGYHVSGTVSESYSTASATGHWAGGLIAYKGTAQVTSSFATGAADGINAGGLVGTNAGGTVQNSYATGSANGTSAGGLIGRLGGGSVSASYSTGEVSGTSAGGLIGSGGGTASHSYWDIDTSKQTTSATGHGMTTSGLQGPGQNSPIYQKWDPGVWHFGTLWQYPALKVDHNRDGTPTASEFGAQRVDSPPKPAVPTAGTVTDTTVEIQWTKVEGAGGYKVQYKPTVWTTWTSIEVSSAPDPPSLVVTGLSTGTEYVFTVSAKGDGNTYKPVYGPASQSLSVTTLVPTVSFTANEFTVDEGEEVEVLLALSSPAKGPFDVNVKVTTPRVSPAERTDYTIAGISGDLVTVSFAAGATTAGFSVRSHDDNGFEDERLRLWVESPPAGVVIGHPSFALVIIDDDELPLPMPPDDLNASSISPTSVTMAWTTVPGVERYGLEYREQGDSWVVVTELVRSGSRVVAGLECGTHYEFWIRSHGDGVSTDYDWSAGYSGEVVVLTGACVAPGAPEVDMSKGSADWTVPGSAVGWSSDGRWAPGSGSAPKAMRLTLELKGLKSDQAYLLRVEYEHGANRVLLPAVLDVLDGPGGYEPLPADFGDTAWVNTATDASLKLDASVPFLADPQAYRVSLLERDVILNGMEDIKISDLASANSGAIDIPVSLGNTSTSDASEELRVRCEITRNDQPIYATRAHGNVNVPSESTITSIKLSTICADAVLAKGDEVRVAVMIVHRGEIQQIIGWSNELAWEHNTGPSLFYDPNSNEVIGGQQIKIGGSCTVSFTLDLVDLSGSSSTPQPHVSTTEHCSEAPGQVWEGGPSGETRTPIATSSIIAAPTRCNILMEGNTTTQATDCTLGDQSYAEPATSVSLATGRIFKPTEMQLPSAPKTAESLYRPRLEYFTGNRATQFLEIIAARPPRQTEQVHKVGRTSGWSTGAVLVPDELVDDPTCPGGRLGWADNTREPARGLIRDEHDAYIECLTRAQQFSNDENQVEHEVEWYLGSLGGDSGAPVFVREPATGGGSTNKITLVGVIWGSDVDHARFVPIDRIYAESLIAGYDWEPGPLRPLPAVDDRATERLYHTQHSIDSHEITATLDVGDFSPTLAYQAILMRKIEEVPNPVAVETCDLSISTRTLLGYPMISPQPTQECQVTQYADPTDDSVAFVDVSFPNVTQTRGTYTVVFKGCMEHGQALRCGGIGSHGTRELQLPPPVSRSFAAQLGPTTSEIALSWIDKVGIVEYVIHYTDDDWKTRTELKVQGTETGLTTQSTIGSIACGSSYLFKIAMVGDGANFQAVMSAWSPEQTVDARKCD